MINNICKKIYLIFTIVVMVTMLSAQENKIPESILVKEDIIYSSVNGYELTLDLAVPRDLTSAVPAPA